MSEPTVYLLDVSFFTFRAYHALPELNTSDGIPTNAIHGVATMLEKLVRTEQPEYLAACFDSPGPGFRNERFPAYKANRGEPDEALKQQFPYIRRLIEAMSIPTVEVPGFEADDLLATLAHQLSAKGCRVVMVTGDKDLMQCVNDRVTLYDPVREARSGAEQVVEKFGVPPAAVTDVQGLMGDATDNIPGIPGVGPKTAQALIQHFGSLEAVLDRSAEIEDLKLRGAASVRKKVEANKESARLSKDLATARIDAPVNVDLDNLRFRSLHTQELLDLAEELEMSRFAARIRALVGESEDRSEDRSKGPRTDAVHEGSGEPAAKAASAAEPPGTDWHDLDAPELVFSLSERSDDAPVLALSDGDRHALVVGEEAIGEAIGTMGERQQSLSGYDVKRLCRRFAVNPGPRTLDVGVASYLYDAAVGDHELPSLIERFLGEPPTAADPSAAARVAELGQLDRLVKLLREGLAERGQTELYEQIELPLIGVLARIEAIGIRLDCQLLAQISKEFEQRMDALVRTIYEAAACEFNILSPVQLRDVLFTKLALPTKGIKQTKTGPSTDVDTLELLSAQHPLPALVLEYRGLAKLKSTYVDALPRQVDAESRIHTTLNQTVTATGRLSSSDPNLQNIPIRTEDGARIRRAFVAGPGNVLVSADYNQIELRVLAHLSADEALIEGFASGRDIHAATAAEVFGIAADAVTPTMRREAKVINFGIIYGMGPTRLARELGISRVKAAEYIDRYFRRYPGVRRFYDRMLAQARTDGYVSTMLGRRRYLPDIHSEHGGRRQFAERVATNTPIQGSAADIIKLAMVRLSRALAAAGGDAFLILQIHDELLVECPEGKLKQVLAMIVEGMEGAVELVVPVTVDVGSGASWAEAH